MESALSFCNNLSKTSTYKNQRGPTLTLIWENKQEETGVLTGSFVTAVGNYPEDIHKPVPINGFYNGNAIAVCINFPHSKQVVALTGNVINNDQEILTLWLDANQAEDPHQKHWNSTCIGSDHFKKIDL